ncbi:hypothetical protein HII31_10475 [Pseudocercospora fuligena]|uniref:Uncharacterized protein n=1 Tax=Pseudocercospora fuligena TaxID=685502 RepID=A0A8H6RA91_9PEZI|nr:hypothetical protein HII31_10475 [Pseudocercospora fuligena]
MNDQNAEKNMPSTPAKAGKSTPKKASTTPTQSNTSTPAKSRRSTPKKTSATPTQNSTSTPAQAGPSTQNHGSTTTSQNNTSTSAKAGPSTQNQGPATQASMTSSPATVQVVLDAHTEPYQGTRPIPNDLQKFADQVNTALRDPANVRKLDPKSPKARA